MIWQELNGSCVESVVEFWISVVEHHASQRRTLGEMMLHEVMVISIDGPIQVHCDSIVKVLGNSAN